jgi:thioredoxin reductase (NADPH)
MAKPIMLTIDDDPQVLQVVGQDLRSQYGQHYRVLGANSGAEALDTLRQLKLRGDTIALLLVDQRMPGMSGVEFLEQAMLIYPEARRVLLTAYADTEAAIRAINAAQIHYYLLKPWHPPEENLYPILDDQLTDWQANFRPPFEGVRVVGHRWSPVAHQARDFLARNQVPYRWFNLESDPEAAHLLEQAGIEAPELPLVIFPDGTLLQAPSNHELAEKAGLRTRAEQPFYDLVIVGGGPAGLAAGVYGASEGLRTLIVECEAPGGQAGMSSRIENYLGFPSGLSGADLARRAVVQARRLGAEILSAQEVTGLSLKGSYRGALLGDGSELGARAILIATGVSYRRLEVSGLDKLTGAGVYYGAALTEGESVRGEDIYIVGGANSAGQAAVYFSVFARNVTMLIRGDSVAGSMSRYLVDRIQATPNICVRLHTEVRQALGEDRLEALMLACNDTGQVEQVPATAIFIFIGARPRTDWLGNAIARDKYGFILSGFDFSGPNRPQGWPLERDPYPLETSLPGVFVAGDVRHGSVKRVASAVGEGSIAVQFIHRYLQEV